MNKHEILKLLNKHSERPCDFSDYQKDSYQSGVDLKSPQFKGLVSDSWVVRGKTGGGYWGDANENVDAEKEKEFTALDNFLSEAMPNIGYFEFKSLLAYVEEQSYTVKEYYGNYLEKKIKYITFNNIFKFIEKNNKKNRPKM